MEPGATVSTGNRLPALQQIQWGVTHWVYGRRQYQNAEARIILGDCYYIGDTLPTAYIVAGTSRLSLRQLPFV